MKWHISDWLLALFGGFLLALMLNDNGIMAKHSTSLFAATVLHGVGAIGSALLIFLFSRVLFRAPKINNGNAHVPLWSYFGGIPGAVGVLLAAVLVNTKLSLAGTFSLMLSGQIMFGIFLDIFGLLGQPKRKLRLNDFFATLCVCIGSLIIIFFGS